MLLLAGVVWAAWPESRDQGVAGALASAGRSPVPALVPLIPPGWQARTDLQNGGYRFRATPPGGEVLEVRGTRTRPADLPPPTLALRSAMGSIDFPPVETGTRPKEVTWEEGGVFYTIQTSSRTTDVEVAELADRLVAPRVALDGTRAWVGDTPLLYLLYLPLLLGLGGWLAYRALSSVPHGAEERTT